MDFWCFVDGILFTSSPSLALRNSVSFFFFILTASQNNSFVLSFAQEAAMVGRFIRYHLFCSARDHSEQWWRKEFFHLIWILARREEEHRPRALAYAMLLLVLLLLLWRSLIWLQNQLTMHIILDEIFFMCVVCACVRFFGAQEKNSSFCFNFSFVFVVESMYLGSIRSFIYLPTVCIIIIHIWCTHICVAPGCRHKTHFGTQPLRSWSKNERTYKAIGRESTTENKRARASEWGCVICIR